MTSSLSNVAGGQYYGIWWDEVTLQSSVVTNVHLQSAGITHNNVALLSASVFWSDVTFLNTLVSTLSATTTSLTNVSGGEAAGVYFRNTQSTNSRFDGVVVEMNGGCLCDDWCTGIVINGSKFGSSTANDWTFSAKGDVTGTKEAIGIKFSDFVWLSGDLGGLNVDVEGDVRSNNIATGILWVLFIFFEHIVFIFTHFCLPKIVFPFL